MRPVRKLRRAHTLIEVLVSLFIVGWVGFVLFIMFLLVKILWNFAFPG